MIKLIPVKEGKEIVYLKETEIIFLRLCCQDISYRQIAAKMGKMPRTIDGYREALLLKLTVRSRTGLVLWCFKTKLMRVSDISQKRRYTKKPR